MPSFVLLNQNTTHIKGPMFRIHPWQNGFDLSITGHFLEVHMSEDNETCLYCHCDVTRGQGVNIYTFKDTF